RVPSEQAIDWLPFHPLVVSYENDACREALHRFRQRRVAEIFVSGEATVGSAAAAGHQRDVGTEGLRLRDCPLVPRVAAADPDRRGARKAPPEPEAGIACRFY